MNNVLFPGNKGLIFKIRVEMAPCFREVDVKSSLRVKSGNLGYQVISDSDLVCLIFQLME